MNNIFNTTEKMDVNVSLIYWEGFDRPWSYTRQLYPPLGTMYVAAALKGKVSKVSLVDAPASRYTSEDILTFLRTERPEYIGFTIYVNQVNSSMKLARMIKEILPDSKIIFGGPHVFVDHEQIMLNCLDVDYCIRGEGEYTLLKLLDALYYSKSLESILRPDLQEKW